MAPLNILISGAGIAGPVLAFWLHRAGISVTIVERARALRSTGQGVDIRGAAVGIIRQMGLEDEIRHHTTRELGIAFIDSAGRDWAVFNATGETDAQSFTSEFEILRGDLASILYRVTKDTTKYVFGDSVKQMLEIDNKVKVVFSKGTPTALFDAVIAADGIGSSVRSLVLGSVSVDAFKSLHQYSGFFTIKDDLLAGGTIAKWYNAPRGRLILLRPTSDRGTQVFLGITGAPADSPEVVDAAASDVGSQKDLLRKTFHDAGWISQRVLEGMEHADDFYYQTTAQIKLETWSQGRVAFLGDAAYCPSPISGMGTTLAITGAYILAGEMMSRPEDLPAAFRRYQEALKPYVVKSQKLIPGAPAIVNPQTKMGIITLLSVLRIASLIGKVVSFIGLDRLIMRIAALPAFSSEPFNPPKYDW